MPGFIPSASHRGVENDKYAWTACFVTGGREGGEHRESTRGVNYYIIYRVDSYSFRGIIMYSPTSCDKLESLDDRSLGVVVL